MTTRGASVNNGNSGGNGNALPPWLRLNRELAEVWEFRYSFWTVQA
jgi:hypothetical protein